MNNHFIHSNQDEIKKILEDINFTIVKVNNMIYIACKKY